MQGRKRWRGRDTDALGVAAPVKEAPPAERDSLDPRAIQAEELRTVEECAFLMGALDKMRDELTCEIRHERAKRGKTGRYAPGKWYSDTISLLNAVNIARNQVQDRRGVIRREREKAKQTEAAIRDERRFVETAKRMLPREQYLAIWEQANILVKETSRVAEK